ncbi:MAG TPA: XTP/dITP diphosphatase [Syntrophomonadaceae bacterium]|nr:XTP/dITP diphosphatase [Syntrophomonadaceae bacterium]
MRKLLIATRNKGKQREIDSLLSPLGIKTLSLNDIPPIPDIKEDGLSFIDNAIKKAQETSKLTGYICLADDSGLVVDALNGRPGIYSARFAGNNATDEANNQKLLDLMEGIEEKNRTARFVCAIAISHHNGKMVYVEGVCEGKIDTRMRGDRGFGYDPLFVPDGFEQSFAQLSNRDKQLISHRGKALEKAVPLIQGFIMGEYDD